MGNIDTRITIKILARDLNNVLKKYPKSYDNESFASWFSRLAVKLGATHRK